MWSRCVPPVAEQCVVLHITSEGFEPLEYGPVGAPSGDRGIDGTNRPRLGDGSALHLEVDSCIPIRSLDAGVSEPVADGDEIDARLEKVDGGRGKDHVRMDALRFEHAHDSCGLDCVISK